MRKMIVVLAVLGLTLSACGRKEPPQPVADAAPPGIAEISHVIVGNSLKIDLKLVGGSYGIGYQIDRAEIDPYCKCPGFWRRYHEELPSPENMNKTELTQLITLKNPDIEYAFRVRAIDALGRFSEWSRTIRAQAELFE